MTHHPTSLTLALDYCPAAIDFMRAGTPRLNEHIFQAGIAAHAVLQEVGNRTWKAKGPLPFDRVERIADRVVRVLVTKGRKFRGDQEPPMHPGDASRGRAIALDYLEARPIDPRGLEHDAFEVALAVTDAYEPAALLESAWLSHIADRVSVFDENGLRVVEARDYKSAWSTGPDDLETTQRKIAILLVRALYPDADLYRRSVVNLRTKAIHAADLTPDDATWRDFKADVQAAVWHVNAAQRTDGTHAPRAGAHCVGCPYVLKCEAAADWVDRAMITERYGTREGRATTWAAAQALVEGLASMVRREADHEPTPIDGGAVGWTTKAKRWANPDAYIAVADEAELCQMDTRSLLLALSLTGGNLAQFAKAAPTLDTPERREEWIGELTHPKAERSFGVIPDKEAEDGDS